jgi:ABC-2 type transport system ATP-binding protein
MSSAGLGLQDIHKSYGSRVVLRGFSGTFLPGRLGALVGPNGAGKTTLLRIAAGLQFADHGSVTSADIVYYGGFDSLPVAGTVTSLRRALGLTPAQPGRDGSLRALSRGQLHSAGLDAAIDMGRSILLLDEPWTSLEPDARERLNERLRLIASEGRVVVCSSHDLDEVARIADDVVLINAGASIWRRRENEAEGRFDRDAILELYRGRS